jgi:hypothetical protein
MAYQSPVKVPHAPLVYSSAALASTVQLYMDASSARGSTAERRAAADLSFRRLANPTTSVDAIAAAITAGTHRRRGGSGAALAITVVGGPG